MQQEAAHTVQDINDIPYKERATLQSLLKIIREIHLSWLGCFTFAIHSLLGAFILPLTFKIVIETLTGLAYTFSLEHLVVAAPLLKQVLYTFQYVQWPLYAVIIAVYWFRCNIKAYNYAFTQSVGVQIREQLTYSDNPICPRCGKPMYLESFTEKIREQVGEHEEYYTEWIGSGIDAHPVTRKEIVPDYADVDHERRYAICQNQYCMYKDKRPAKKDVALYRFAEMPYKIADTINYSVRTHAKTNQAAGDIQQYPHGMSLTGYSIISVIALMLCVFGNFSSVILHDLQNDPTSFLILLAISEGIVLCLSIVFQLIVHVRQKKQDWNYIEIHDDNQDGCTIILSDGTKFHAETDRYAQNMIDMYCEMQRMQELSFDNEE